MNSARSNTKSCRRDIYCIKTASCLCFNFSYEGKKNQDSLFLVPIFLLLKGSKNIRKRKKVKKRQKIDGVVKIQVKISFHPINSKPKSSTKVTCQAKN